MGTAVGTRVFVQHGWRAAASVSMAWYGLQLAVLLVRGPHVERYTWFGYQGGLEARKTVVTAREKKRAEEAAATAAPDVQEDQNTKEAVRSTSVPASSKATVGEDKKDPSQFA